jgi:hypothetical protein
MLGASLAGGSGLGKGCRREEGAAWSRRRFRGGAVRVLHPRGAGGMQQSMWSPAAVLVLTSAVRGCRLMCPNLTGTGRCSCCSCKRLTVCVCVGGWGVCVGGGGWGWGGAIAAEMGCKGQRARRRALALHQLHQVMCTAGPEGVCCVFLRRGSKACMVCRGVCSPPSGPPMAAVAVVRRGSVPGGCLVHSNSPACIRNSAML